jgi:N-acetylglucosamine malate deacetylase 1
MIDILAFGSHPDDIEFGCGGILAKAVAQGHKVAIADLTIGEQSTNGDTPTRRKEGENAAAVIGAERVVLDFADCEIFDTYEGRLKLVEVIRKFRPKLVLAPLWQGIETHPDHTACGILARHACRYAKFAKILPNLPPHAVEGILHYLPNAGGKPDFIIDVSAHVPTWKKMMQAHQSQLKTYPYDQWALKGAASLGTLIGAEYAQGLAKGNPIVIDDPLTIAKAPREL